MTDDYDAYPVTSTRRNAAGVPVTWTRPRSHTRGQGTRDLVDTLRQSLNEALVGTSARSDWSLAERIAAERNALEAMLDTIAERLARKNAQLAQLNIWPDDDPFEDGDRLEFKKTFPNSDRAYTYLALRQDGTFFVTGARSPQGITWRAFVDWCGLGVTEVYRIGGKGGRRKVIG